jgi:polar amino acid transport system substrate-binding protein
MTFERVMFITAAALLTLGWTPAPAFAAGPATKEKLVVGTKVTPPFAMKNDDGGWYGISVDLWRQITKELEMEFEWRELDLQGLLNGVERRSIDAAVAALTITAEREKTMDFTHPFYRTGLSIAVSTQGSSKFLTVATILALSFFAIGFAMWFRDWIRHRRSNRATREIRTGLLLVALVVIVSSLIAHIITFINLNAIPINGPDDLQHIAVATVPSSTSESYLHDHDIRYRKYPSLVAGLRAVSEREVDAILYDTALLRYLAKTRFKNEIRVLPLTFEVQEYGIALASGSPLRENVNLSLIAIIQTPGWQALVDRYLADGLQTAGGNR